RDLRARRLVRVAAQGGALAARGRPRRLRLRRLQRRATRRGEDAGGRPARRAPSPAAALRGRSARAHPHRARGRRGGRDLPDGARSVASPPLVRWETRFHGCGRRLPPLEPELPGRASSLPRVRRTPPGSFPAQLRRAPQPPPAAWRLLRFGAGGSLMRRGVSLGLAAAVAIGGMTGLRASGAPLSFSFTDPVG